MYRFDKNYFFPTQESEREKGLNMTIELLEEFLIRGQEVLGEKEQEY